MTHFERIHTAMRHEKPDRVPVMCQLSLDFIGRNHGRNINWRNAENVADAFLNMREMFVFDGVLLDITLPNDWRVDLDLINAGKKPRRHTGKCEPQEFDRIDPDKIRLKYDFTNDMGIHEIVAQKSREGDFSVHGEIDSPYDYLIQIFGLQDAMMALLLYPEECHAVLEKSVLSAFSFAKAQIDVGVDAMKISSPYAGGSFISREHYSEFVLPYEKEVVSRIHSYKPGIPVYTHTCGFIGDRLELMMATGLDGIECMDPPPLGDTFLSDAKNRVGDKLFLKGNMDSVNVLLSATTESIEGYVAEMISDGAYGGGYILSTACSIAPGVALEIIKLLVLLAKKYGTY